MKRTKLRLKGHSTTAELKEEIQALVRKIVIKRDGGCVLRNLRHCEEEPIVLQADHLITRSNSATYADTRLIVCLCKRCHNWKRWNKEQYDNLMKNVLPIDRVELWEKCEKDRWQPVRTGAYDWKIAIVALNQEYEKMS